MTEEAVMYLVGFLFFHIIEGERGNRFTKWNFLTEFSDLFWEERWEKIIR